MPREKERREKKTKEKEKEEAAIPAAEAAASPAAAEEEDKPAPAVTKRDEPKKKIGNVFALFNQSQIQEFKEAFTMIDQDRDGIIGPDDLAAIYNQIGREPDPRVIKEMLSECSEKLNFTHFLTLFGEKLHGTDSESTLRDAFVMFDEEKTGKLGEEYVKDLLMNVGDQYSKEEIKNVWKEAPIEGGQLDYLKLVHIMKRGADDELA